ncbi:1-aminocyclopropane-1-carboxylate deaminase [Flavobacterium longum]|uniref:1-aminocyclopropane-1-carboxylate deaminase/D-cysteine desulfhydrase n=1 Tax=Flavobacterium longum TaxID=1299340 RepID=UPI0039E8F6C1
MEVTTQTVHIPDRSVTLSIRREDLIHPVVSGNKFRKLKYNLLEAAKQNHTRLLTFGGAFSNHIAAVAAAGRMHGFDTIGIIRGEELEGKVRENPTLSFAANCGMKLVFVSREAYRQKANADNITAWQEQFGSFYLLPEGGTNALAVKGCEEILTQADADFDYLCCAAGTGGTAAGLINASQEGQQVLVFPSLKGNFLGDEIRKFTSGKNWRIIPDYHFGGYGRITPELVSFINRFHLENGVPLDPVYTGKMLFGVMDMINRGSFPTGSKILAIHTGGLQGIEGMNNKLKRNKQPLITTNV